MRMRSGRSMSSSAVKTPTVLITGVGAIIGQGIIKSLRMEDRPVRIIGIDRNPDAFGARRCDRFHPKPLNEEGPFSGGRALLR